MYGRLRQHMGLWILSIMSRWQRCTAVRYFGTLRPYFAI